MLTFFDVSAPLGLESTVFKTPVFGALGLPGHPRVHLQPGGPEAEAPNAVSYTHLTLPTNREV